MPNSNDFFAVDEIFNNRITSRPRINVDTVSVSTPTTNTVSATQYQTITHDGIEYDIVPYNLNDTEENDRLLFTSDVLNFTDNYTQSFLNVVSALAGKVVTVSRKCGDHLHILEDSATTDGCYKSKWFAGRLQRKDILPIPEDMRERFGGIFARGHELLTMQGNSFTHSNSMRTAIETYAEETDDICEISSYFRHGNGAEFTTSHGLRRVVINWSRRDSALMSDCISIDGTIVRKSALEVDESELWYCHGCNTFHLPEEMDGGRVAVREYNSHEIYCTYGDESIIYCEDIDAWSTEFYEGTDDLYYYFESNCPRPLIADYHNAPELIFYGDKDASSFRAHIGFELEIECPRNSPEKVAQLVKDATKDHVFFERDGSLDHGVEIISHPHTIELSRALLKNAAKAVMSAGGCQSHTGGNCGLHIHVSKDSFTKLQIAKILILMIKFNAQMEKFSRRNGNYHYCRPMPERGYYNSLRYTESDAESKADEQRQKGKYWFLNIRRGETFEFRLFRGSLNSRTLLACIDLVELLCNASDYSLADIADMTWTKLMEKAPETLKTFCDKRGI